MSRRILRPLLILIFGVCTPIAALPQMPNPYGHIRLEQAKKIAAPAIAEALKMNLTVAVAIADTSGNFVYYEKMDNIQLASAQVAISKTRSSAVCKRPTKVFEDVLTAGGSGLRTLGLPGVVPVEGGVPLLLDGRIVGAVGFPALPVSRTPNAPRPVLRL